MSYLIDEHCDALVLTHSPNTVADRRRILWQLHKQLRHGIAYANEKQIRDWLATPGWSDNTRRTYGGHVLEAFRWWFAEGLVTPNPAAKIRTPKARPGKPRPAGEDVIALLLGEPEPLPTIVLLGAYAGLRRAEMAACHRGHITEDVLWIPRAKGGAEQSVPCHPLVWAHVADLPDGPLLRNRAGGQMDPDQLSGYWRRARRRLGLPETLVPHQLRHRFGTQVRREHDVLVAQKALRHSSLTSTAVYTAVDNAEVVQAIRALRPPAQAA